MANEIKRYVHATTTTLEANGASIASGAIGQANDASLDLGSYTAPADYPNARFVFTGTFASAPTANRSLELIARELDVDGTTDTPAPTATYRQKLQAVYIVEATATQTLVVDVYDCPRKADWYLYSDAGVTLNAGWTLKATPFSFGPV
jgi:hypothetical protein